VSLLIRRITLAVLSLALVGAAFTLPAAAKKDPVASASKKCKKKSKKASVAKKKKKCGSGGGGGGGSSGLPGVPSHPSTVQPPSTPAPPTFLVDAIDLTDATVLGGTGTNGSVTISSPAPSGGQTVDLQSSAPGRVSVPSAVQVAPGQVTAGFAVTTTTGPTVTPGITASIGSSSQSVFLKVVDKPSIVALNLDHNCFPEGQTNFGASTVSLDVPAPVNETVALSSNSSLNLNPTNPTVTVPAGSRTAVFGVDTPSPGNAITITGDPADSSLLGTANDTADVRSTATASQMAPGGLTLSPDHVTVGDTPTGTVTLDCEALAGGAVVHLSSSDPNVVVPSTVTVDQDKLSKTFDITTSGASPGDVTISAWTNNSPPPGDTRTAVLSLSNLGT
jgi:hypothetical protein